MSTYTLQIHKRSGAAYVLRWEDDRITGHHHNYPKTPTPWWIEHELPHLRYHPFAESERELTWANSQEWGAPLTTSEEAEIVGVTHP